MYADDTVLYLGGHAVDSLNFCMSKQATLDDNPSWYTLEDNKLVLNRLTNTKCLLLISKA